MASLLNMSGGSLLKSTAGILPAGYRQLEYIESTGTQYIDTGYTPNSSSKFDLTFSDVNSWIMGCVSYAGSLDDTGIAKKTIRFGTQVIANITYPTNKVNITVDKYGYSINTIANSWQNIAQLIGNRNIYLFWANGSSAVKSGKLYSCKFYEDSILILDFIPCKDPNNVVGMYDTVNGVFYSSPNGAAFVAGPEV